MKAPSGKELCRVKSACHCPILLQYESEMSTTVGTQMGKSWGCAHIGSSGQNAGTDHGNSVPSVLM